MKKIIAIMLLASLAISATACNSKTETNNANETTTDTAVVDTASENENETDTQTDTQTTKNQVMELSPLGGMAVLYNGEVYVNVYDSTPNIDGVYGEGEYQKLLKSRDAYKEYTFGNLEVKVNGTYNGTTKWQKLDVSGIKAIYNNEYGQDIVNYDVKYGILMINSDNTLSYISIADLIEGKGNATKLDTSNVTDIVTEDHGGLDTYFITADGTKTNVNEYIK